MDSVTKKTMLDLIRTLQDGERKSALLAHMISSGEITEADLAEIMIADVEANTEKFAEMFNEDLLLGFLYERFKDNPIYLARALVRIKPDVFYAYGFAFRLIIKLRAKLGVITIRPHDPINDPVIARFHEQLPDLVPKDVMSLDMECQFRRYLYCMSRDAEIGLELINEDIASAPSAYERKILEHVRGHCLRLVKMKHSDFVDNIGDSTFPGFHVNWWLDKTKDVERVLNIGDTGTYKTSFAVIAMHEAGCKKILVICPPHGRTHWLEEVELYFRQGAGKIFVIKKQSDVAKAKSSDAQFIVVGYSTIIKPAAVNQLLEIPFDGLVWDEAHYGKNATGRSPAKRAAATQRLIQNLPLTKLIVLCATAWENHPREFAAIANAIRPDIFPSAESFRQSRPEDPRFIRELFDENIVEVEITEIADLPPITPEMSKDLFGAVYIEPSEDHMAMYNFLLNDEAVALDPMQKVGELLMATTHPHKLAGKYPWTEAIAKSFDNWKLSTKLRWVKQEFERQLAQGAKCVLATGIFVQGVTRPDKDDAQNIWVGQLMQDWFGEEKVLILDSSVSQAPDATGHSDRSRLIKRWRFDPKIKILVVSMRTCPDTINLSVPDMDGVDKLFLTTVCYPWVPWKQFLGRFWRKGLGVPLEYAVPVLRGTLDENLLQMIGAKWATQQLFRALVALSPDELERLNKKISLRKLAEDSRSDKDRVNLINLRVRRSGEAKALKVLEDMPTLSTNAEAFARSFLITQEFGTSGHVSRFMVPVIERFINEGMVHAEGILDAGCGTLTLERCLDLPICGIDFNTHMIEFAKPHSKHAGKNAQVGCLSSLPKEWTDTFELVVSSLVLDWTTLKKVSVPGTTQKLSERLMIINQLMRVTHPLGRIWLTFTRSCMNTECLEDWKTTLRGIGCTIIDDLTGMVRATGAVTKSTDKAGDFHFWSICFTPGSKNLSNRDADGFKFLFEKTRIKYRHGASSNGDSNHDLVEPAKVLYNAFEVVQDSGTAQTDVAAAAASTQEINRLISQASKSRGWQFHKAPDSLTSDWRLLEKLQRKGLLDQVLKKHGGC